MAPSAMAGGRLVVELRCHCETDEVYQTLREAIFRGVMLHEIGHTIGLRHNFQGSFDALNYHDEFWAILERGGEPDELNRQRLPEHRYASIMDYGARFNSDTKGLGKYDAAAIKYVYGQHIEAFDDAVNVPGRLDLELEFQDYSKIPEMLGGDSGNLTARVDRPVSDLRAAKQAGVLQNADLVLQNRDQSPANEPSASSDTAPRIVPSNQVQQVCFDTQSSLQKPSLVDTLQGHQRDDSGERGV